MADNEEGAPAAGSRLRFSVGAVVFGVGFLSPLLVPLVAASNLSTEWKTGLSGLLLLGIPEIGMLVAVAIMGKDGCEALKGILRRVFKQLQPATKPIGRWRHRMGVAMFVTPLAFGWLFPFAMGRLPELSEHRIALGIGGDALLVASLFVLGGEFWEKLGALFVRSAKAQKRY
jgi:hypothetical protein